MIKSLETPNLPQGKVRHVAVNNCNEALTIKLSQLGIEPIITVQSPNLDCNINYHTDMLLINYEKGHIIADSSQKKNFVNFLTIGYRCDELNSHIKSPYPCDSLLNAVFLGNKLICNPKTVEKSLVEYAEKSNKKIVAVNQGYAKCSISVVSDNALITDDESIYNACKKAQIDVLLISKGSVKLDGFNYGFIGGCTGLIDKNKLLFNGDINYHNDHKKIIDFLKTYDVEPIYIENQPLFDIGSIIPLTEEM